MEAQLGLGIHGCIDAPERALEESRNADTLGLMRLYCLVRDCLFTEMADDLGLTQHILDDPIDMGRHCQRLLAAGALSLWLLQQPRNTATA